MKKIKLVLVSFLLIPAFAVAQPCDCNKNFEWLKKTFEENDAGFLYALQQKGRQAYEDHNKRIAEKIKSAKTLNECTPLLSEWLRFFRSGHVGMRLLQQPSPAANAAQNGRQQFTNWETNHINTTEFKKYLDKTKTPGYEGIWQTPPYSIAIKKVGDQYIGSILESGADTWTPGQVKLKFSVKENEASSVFYMRDHSPVESGNVALIGNNHLQIGNFNLTRTYPLMDDETKYEQYFKMLGAQKPYMELLNNNTLYFRIPSFQDSEKKAIDSVINANRQKILSTKNLIIDIRNGTGGSDASYKEILPFIYTNPVRTVGVEYLSTKLNNQRMLDFINKPEYGFDEEGKQWAKTAYEKLDKALGKFVNINESNVTIDKYDTIYPYPQNVGIIINQGNGSTDEQFLLAAKQSKKVKLFGTTTRGVLDVSNMYFVNAPCNEFELGYSLTRSMRIPEFTIDDKGLQPDFYLDKSIPPYEWTQYVNDILNQR